LNLTPLFGQEEGCLSTQYKHVPAITRVFVMGDMTRAGGTLE